MDNEQNIIPAEETPETEKTRKSSSFWFDILEMFAWSLFAVFLLFTFAVRLCRVDGSSMENTLYEGENLLLYSVGYTPEQDDIIVFHLTNPDADLEKTLVKRVIATGGQSLRIDFKTGEILVDGVKYEDSHAVLKNSEDVIVDQYNLNGAEHHYDPITRVMSLTVPKDHLFVMGDNRNWSKDSRDLDIMFVDERSVLGKVILRLSPFTLFP
ncbi:MAG: signal peptidase I [Clostridia bacterium]|nr:signal peptidase I [Clostridia bacterium]